MTKTRIMVATPMYGGMCSGHYVMGLLASVNTLRERNVSVSWCHLMNESLITRARNELVRVFLERGANYLMFVDADIGFAGGAIATLLDANVDVVAGLYPKKEIDWANVNRAAAMGKTQLERYSGAYVFNPLEQTDVPVGENRLAEVRHAGTGFMLIKRGVFEKLQSVVPTYRVSTHQNERGEFFKPLVHEFFATSIDASGALLSEDYHFCDLWRANGGKIYVSPFIELSHVGTQVFTGDLFLSGGNVK